MSNLSEGEVEIDLNGTKLTLKPTLAAIKALSRTHGGMNAVIQGLIGQNFETAVAVIRFGANMSDRDARNLEDRVFRNGLTTELLTRLIEYVGMLANGGKPVVAAEPEPASEGND